METRSENVHLKLVPDLCLILISSRKYSECIQGTLVNKIFFYVAKYVQQFSLF